MTAPTRYRERLAQDEQPQVDVDVMSPATWGSPGAPLFHVIRYPDCSGILRVRVARDVVEQAVAVLQATGFEPDDLAKLTAALLETIPGREYIIDDEMLERHFEILPQTFRVQAWGGVFERPMKKQRELDEQLDGDSDGESADV